MLDRVREPILTSGYDAAAADDPMLVFNLADQVRETIQHTLYRLLSQRRACSSDLGVSALPDT